MDELIKFLEDHAKPRPETAHYHAISQDGRNLYGKVYGTVCHRALFGLRGVWAIASRTQRAPNYPEALDYLKWLCGEASPWRRVFEAHGSFPDPEYVLKHGLLISNLDKLGPDLPFSLLVAHRVIWEKWDIVKPWARSVKDGVNPCLAMFFSYVDTLTDKRQAGSGHYPIEITGKYVTDLMFTNMNAGNEPAYTKSFMDIGAQYGVTSAWGHEGQRPYLTKISYPSGSSPYECELIKRYSEFAKPNGYQDLFKNEWVTQPGKFIEPKHITHIALQETKRLFG